jgi:hypothetical protein
VIAAIDFLTDISSTGLLIIKLVAAVGGFVVGYFVSGPFWRLFWRGAMRKPIPPALLPWMKFCTGLVFAALLYSAVHFGGGGWGFGGPGGGGSGVGGGTGDGKGDGKSGGKGETTTPGDPGKKGPATTPPAREILVVELLGGNRYPGDGKYYLIDRKEPPVTLAAIDEMFKKRGAKIELHIHYAADSVGQRHAAAERLRDAAQKYGILLVETVDAEK